MEKWVVLGASAGAVLFMVGVAAILGFRKREKLTEDRLRALAAAEGYEAGDILIDAKGREGLARLPGGKVLVARVMADGVSARVADAATARLRGARLIVTFADIGFPPLHLRLSNAPPAWVREMAQEH